MESSKASSGETSNEEPSIRLVHHREICCLAPVSQSCRKYYVSVRIISHFLWLWAQMTSYVPEGHASGKTRSPRPTDRYNFSLVCFWIWKELETFLSVYLSFQKRGCWIRQNCMEIPSKFLKLFQQGKKIKECTYLSSNVLLWNFLTNITWIYF